MGRVLGRTLTRPVADPLTGELLAEPGVTVSRELAELFDKKGVKEAYIEVETEEGKTSTRSLPTIPST